MGERERERERERKRERVCVCGRHRLRQGGREGGGRKGGREGGEEEFTTVNFKAEGLRGRERREEVYSYSSLVRGETLKYSNI